MCTVSYINGLHGRIITSNRDENIGRKSAIPPKTYRLGQCKLVYPKDPEKKGTWIAVRKDGWVAVLLNGALEPFEKSTLHTISRGQIILEIFQHWQIVSGLKSLSLERVAPFTLVLSNISRLMLVRWDGRERQIQDLDIEKSYLWSSATLYDPVTMHRKEQDFKNFMESTGYDPSPTDVIKFHKGHYSRTKDGMLYNDVTGIKTLSITQARPDTLGCTLVYHELERRKKFLGRLKLINSNHP